MLDERVKQSARFKRKQNSINATPKHQFKLRANCQTNRHAFHTANLNKQT